MANSGTPQSGIHRIREARREQMFPVLDERQLEILAPYGQRRRYPAGATLFEAGQRHIAMFVVLSGTIDMFRYTVTGEDLFATHGPGIFTGEVGQLAGSAAIATARAHEDTEVLVIDEVALHRLVIADAELSELIMRAFILRRMALIEEETDGATVVGSRHSRDTLRLRQFLTRNAHPHVYLDVDGDPAMAQFLERFGVVTEELPVVIMADGRVLRTPSNRELADYIGLGPDPLDGRKFDVAVLGAGPGGLAAAVYAASEGLRVLVLDAKAPGGQAGTSSRIENYFGFPTGITGQALAGRGFVQAQKFGAEIAIPRKVLRLARPTPDEIALEIDGGERVTARAVVIATGARYRKPNLPNLEVFEGRGIYYAASFMEAQLCAEQEVIVVGGGNSAGQAAVFLAGHTKHVHILVRSRGLAASMSQYLIQRIEATPNITLRTETEIVELLGTGDLGGVRWQNRASLAIEEHAVQHVFLFLGAEPNTALIDGCLTLDAAGFVKTGASLTEADLRAAGWSLPRAPYPLESSRSGIFAVGDVRSDSVKRVATAVGEGAAAVRQIHALLSESERPSA